MQSKEFNRLPVEVQITGGGSTSLARGVWWSPRMLVSGLHIMSLTGEGLAPGQNDVRVTFIFTGQTVK